MFILITFPGYWKENSAVVNTVHFSCQHQHRKFNALNDTILLLINRTFHSASTGQHHSCPDGPLFIKACCSSYFWPLSVMKKKEQWARCCTIAQHLEQRHIRSPQECVIIHALLTTARLVCRVAHSTSWFSLSSYSLRQRWGKLPHSFLMHSSDILGIFVSLNKYKSNSLLYSSSKQTADFRP